MENQLIKFSQKEKEKVILLLFDSPGFKLKEEQRIKVINEAEEKIKKGYQSNNINKQIHCILYCINTVGNKIEETEIKFIKKLINVSNEY